MRQVSEEDIDRAFKRLQDLALVHRGSSSEEVGDALWTVLKSYGLDDVASERLTIQLRRFIPDAKDRGRGYMLIGIMVGLSILDN